MYNRYALSGHKLPCITERSGVLDPVLYVGHELYLEGTGHGHVPGVVGIPQPKAGELDVLQSV